MMDAAMRAPPENQIIIYQSADGQAQLEVNLRNDTLWLSLDQIAGLFDRDKSVISRHIKNIFSEKELMPAATVAKNATVQIEGDRRVTREIDYYNLDMILSVGYRVSSGRATQFRIWSTNVLRDYLVKGAALNQKRLAERNLSELEATIGMIRQAMDRKQLTTDEAQGLLQVVTDYADTWLTLQRYDEDALTEPKGRKPGYEFTVAAARAAITQLKTALVNQKQATDLFGRERGESFAGIIGNLYQTFGGDELYPTIEHKAAHLLYLVIKDHPFTDGN